MSNRRVHRLDEVETITAALASLERKAGDLDAGRLLAHLVQIERRVSALAEEVAATQLQPPR